MNVEDLNFKNGLIYLSNLQMYLCPANYFLCIINFIKENYPINEYNKIIRDVSKNDMNIVYKDISKKNSNPKIIVMEFLNIINFLGFGKVELKNFDPCKLSFTLKNQNLKKIYQNIFDDKIECEFIIGALLNFFEIMFNKKYNLEIEETDKLTVYKLISNDLEFKQNTEEFFYQNPERIGEVSQTIKKILLNGALEVNQGIVKMSGMCGVFIPYFSFINLLIKIQRDFGERFILNLAYMQGKAAIDMHVHYGADRGVQSWLSAISLADISGIGKIDIKNEEYNRIFLKDNLTYFQKFYDDLDIEIVRKHFRVMYKAGYDFSFNTSTNYKAISDSEYVLDYTNCENEISDEMRTVSKILTTKVLITNSF